MANNLQKKLFEQGYLRVKNVLNYQRDLKPILNDMEFVMDCLIQKFAKKMDIKKILNLDIDFSVSKGGYRLRPHRDDITRLYNFLIYLTDIPKKMEDLLQFIEKNQRKI